MGPDLGFGSLIGLFASRIPLFPTCSLVKDMLGFKDFELGCRAVNVRRLHIEDGSILSIWIKDRYIKGKGMNQILASHVRDSVMWRAILKSREDADKMLTIDMLCKLQSGMDRSGHWWKNARFHKKPKSFSPVELMHLGYGPSNNKICLFSYGGQGGASLPLSDL